MKPKLIFLLSLFFFIIFVPFAKAATQEVKLVKNFTTMVPKFPGDIPVVINHLPKDKEIIVTFRQDHLTTKKFIRRTSVTIHIARKIPVKTEKSYLNAEDETGIFQKTRQEYENALKSHSWKKEFDVEAYRTGNRIYRARYVKARHKTIDFKLEQNDRFDAKLSQFTRDVGLWIVGRDYEKARPKEAAGRLGFGMKSIFQKEFLMPAGYEGVLLPTLTVDANFPDDIPLPIGFELMPIQKTGNGWHMSFFDGGKGGLEDFVMKYKKKFEEQGWAETRFDANNSYEGSAGWKFIGGDRKSKAPDSYRLVVQKGSREVDFTVSDTPSFGFSIEMNITK